ncbi:MAG: LytTR family DNA-binding domain-containing protein [Steroidobacteraceae bacterium]
MEATFPTPETDTPRRDAPGSRRPTARELAFLYLIPPLLMALPLGMYRAGIGLPLPLSLILWTSVCLISWWLSEAFAHLASRVLRPWHPPLWLVLTIGYLLNLWISSLYNVPIVAALVEFGRVPLTPDLAAYFDMERSLVDPHYLLMLLRAGAAGLVIWLTVNLLFQRLTASDRFALAVAAARSAATTAHAPVVPPATQPVPAQPPTPPRFFGRLDKLRGLPPADLLAVEAEDHYIRVHSRRGKELIYYRFRDALEDLHGWDGIRAHRSVWIRRDSFVKVEESGRATWVVLESGERLPVSFAHRALVRAAVQAP